jgi:arylsulfatase A-like enzyme
VRTDRQLGELFDFLDKQIGLRNIVVVMTADHGAAPVPEVNKERRMPGGRVMTQEAMRELVQKRMTEWYGEGKWVLGYSGPAPYLNHDLIREKRLELAEVRRRLAETMSQVPHIFRIYTPEQLASGATRDDQIDRRVRNGFFAARTPDLYIVADPYWIFDRAGTGHGTPHNYDAHVPIVFLGAGIRPGKYSGRVSVTDIAPTLTSLLEIDTPSGSVGRVLGEALVGSHQ